MAQPTFPPRATSVASSASSVSSITSDLPRRSDTIHLTPYAKHGTSPYSNVTGLDDPRTSSTQSLRPVESAGEFRRTLLLIYIHGFMGTETSFKSFPAHVHSLLTMTLSETHVVHSKIYPRYQSRKHISFARDAFSNWLQPHETDQTDIVLLGHSLGGILGAEVVLLPSHTPGSKNLFQHRILGLIAYDTPFLGMHPGVVTTGIASLFRSAPEKPADAEDSGSDAFSGLPQPVSSDPNFNPAFPNDVRLPVRKSKFDRAMYFFTKHSGDISKAAQSYVKSHLEFGGCLADYPGLNKRYNAIRPLEDIDGTTGKRDQNGKYVPRVRFVNYYTASTGRIKERKPSQEKVLVAETEMKDLSGRSQSLTPSISVQEHTEDEVILKEVEDLDIGEAESEMEHVEPKPVTPSPDRSVEDFQAETAATQTSTGLSSVQSHGLPPIPAEPIEPAALDSSTIDDPEILKIVQKAREREMKAFEQAKKDREKAIKERNALVAKREKAAKKAEEKNAKAEESRLEKERLKRQVTLNQEAYDQQLQQEATERGTQQAKKQRDRKFCALPKKDPQTGRRDPTWVRVFMANMDEVVAHTSLFIVGEEYAKLVGDTAERIEEWIDQDATRRAIESQQYAA